MTKLFRHLLCALGIHLTGPAFECETTPDDSQKVCVFCKRKIPQHNISGIKKPGPFRNPG